MRRLSAASNATSLARCSTSYNAPHRSRRPSTQHRSVQVFIETRGCPDFSGVRFWDSCCRLRLMARLELDRCEHTQRRVTPLPTVEDLQVLRNGVHSTTREGAGRELSSGTHEQW